MAKLGLTRFAWQCTRWNDVRHRQRRGISALGNGKRHGGSLGTIHRGRSAWRSLTRPVQPTILGSSVKGKRQELLTRGYKHSLLYNSSMPSYLAVTTESW